MAIFIRAYVLWEVVLMELSSSDPEATGPPTASVLRSIPFGRLVSRARSNMQGELERALEWSSKIDDDTAALHRARWEDPKRRGRRGHSPDHYRDVAEVYRNAWLLGDNPMQAVARSFLWQPQKRRSGFQTDASSGS